MHMIKVFSVKACLFSLLPAAIMVSANVAAKVETLECTLYIAESMGSDARSSVELKDADLVLDSVRRSSLCVFGDGQVADKQFVMVARAVGDGSTGSNLGFSTYTMQNGDSISAKFTGNWGSEGFKGVYTILGGTGSYNGATGDGTITGAESPWATTGIVEIVLNVNTP